MDIYKFGGASLKDAASIRKMGEIIEKADEKPFAIIISALGKTTNELEKVWKFWLSGDNEQAIALLDKIVMKHFDLSAELEKGTPRAGIQIKSLGESITTYVRITEANQALADKSYSKIVSLGEQLSSLVIYSYLKHCGMNTSWADASNYVTTQNDYRNARINTSKTNKNIQKLAKKVNTIAPGSILITQGFIASTISGMPSTLGREGSDYTAALFAWALDADRLLIWKDVPGFLNADPAMGIETKLLEKLPYSEAIELVYYGAKILHPKTIWPVHEKNIPVYIKSFEQADGPGTLIKNYDEKIELPPCYISREGQVLCSLQTQNLKFINEKHIQKIYRVLSKLDIRIHLVQNSALALSLCFDYDEEKIKTFMDILKDEFTILYNYPVRLLNIRYYDDASEKEARKGQEILLEQKSRKNLQLVIRSSEDSIPSEQITW